MFPRRDDRYAVTIGLMYFRFKKTPRDKAKRSRDSGDSCPARIARIIYNVRAAMPLCKQNKNSTRVLSRAIGMLSRILPLKSISADVPDNNVKTSLCDITVLIAASPLHLRE